MGKKSVDLHLHGILLLFIHMSASVLSSKSSFGCRLTSTLLCKLLLGCTGTKVTGKLKPREVLGPAINIKAEFEPHVGR